MSNTEELFGPAEMAAHRAQQAANRSEHYAAIRAYYVALWPVMKVTERFKWAADPQAMEWVRFFSPIEAAFWSDLRESGVVMYPQHPVGRHFVDFGHPVARVAVECDGAEFHMDKAKDEERQREIEAKGWTVYRLSGRQCMQRGRSTFNDEGEEVFELTDSQQLVRMLGREYGLSGWLSRKAA